MVEASAIPGDRRIENAAGATPGATQPATTEQRNPGLTGTFLEADVAQILAATVKRVERMADRGRFV